MKNRGRYRANFSQRERLKDYLIEQFGTLYCLNPKCGSTSNLERHHIYGMASYPHLKYNPDNIIMLCHDCHVKFHNILIRKRKFLTKYDAMDTFDEAKELCNFLRREDICERVMLLSSLTQTM